MSKIQSLSNIQPFSFDQLFDKLKKVQLKGWPEILPYSESTFEVKTLQPNEVKNLLYTPQPKVYLERLDRLSELDESFKNQGMDSFTSLTQCYDFTATSPNDLGETEEADWTLIPPIIEALKYPTSIDYPSFTSGILPSNVEFLPDLPDKKVETTYPLICDGDHRIYFAVKNNLPITVLLISNIKKGYPYYALPQKYWKKELATRADGELPENAQFDKIHILPKADEKKLYRLFPSAGIQSGGVRKDAKPKE